LVGGVINLNNVNVGTMPFLREKKLFHFFLCIKLYLGMEEWFHGHNPKRKVHASHILIGKTLQLIKDVFP
jgi:hypothetical protein